VDLTVDGKMLPVVGSTGGGPRKPKLPAKDLCLRECAREGERKGAVNLKEKSSKAFSNRGSVEPVDFTQSRLKAKASNREQSLQRHWDTSGITAPRQHREMLQRLAAERRVVEEWKSKGKVERKREILLKRDKRSGVGIEFQRGRFMPASPEDLLPDAEAQARTDILHACTENKMPFIRDVRDILHTSAMAHRMMTEYGEGEDHSELFEFLPKHISSKLKPRSFELLDVEWQSGKVLPAVAGVAMTLMLSRLTKLIKRNSTRVVDSMKTLVDQVQDLANKFKKAVGKVLWTVPLVMILFYAISQVENKHLSNPVVALLLSAFAVVIGPKLWAVVSKFFPDGNVQQQAGLMDNAGSLLASLFTFSVFKGKKVNASIMTEFCKRVTMFDRMSGGFDLFIKWVMSSIDSLVNWIRGRFGKERIDLFKRNNDPLKKWALAIDNVCRDESLAENVDPDKLDRMVELIRVGYGYKELYRGTQMMREVDSYLIKISNAMQPYLGTLNARNNFRFEPAALMLLGAPAVGKTILMMPLCAAVMLESGLLPPGSNFDDIAKNVWQKGTSEFWNSYSNQICLVMDDAFQMRADATDKENEYITMIRMVGSWSFPLNFADLSSKGRMFFGSKFIVGTTNLSSINAEAKLVLHEPEAVTRRINFPYLLTVKQEFALDGGKLNYKRFTEELAKCRAEKKGMDAFPWYIWECRKHDFLSGSTEITPVPLQEVVNNIARDLKQRAESHTATKDFLTDFVAGFAEQQAGRRIEGPESVDYEFDCSYDRFEEQADEFIRINLDAAYTFDHFLLHLTQGVLVGLAVKLVITFAWGLLQNMLGALFRKIRGKSKQKKDDDGEIVIHQSNRPLYTKHLKVKAKVGDPVFQSVDSQVAANIYANSYKASVKVGNGDFVLGQIIFLMSTLAVQPYHFTRALRDMVKSGEIETTAVFTLRNAGNSKHEVTMSVAKFLSLKRVVMEERDIEFLDFGVMQAHRNITKNFMKETDIKYLKGNRARLDICEIDDRRNIVPVNKRNVCMTPSLRFGEDLRVSGKQVARYYEYMIPTTQGDCGAPLCLFDNSSYSGRSCIGFHVAGNPARGVGYSTILTQEMISTAVAELEVIVDSFEEDLTARGVVHQAGLELPFENKGSFLPLLEVDRPVVICPKTSYFLTEWYGCYGEYECRPAPMRPVWRDHECIFPMENAVKNYSTPLLIYEQKWLRQAVHVAMSPLTSLTKDSSRRIYTFEEAVLGIPEEKFRSIPRGTAAGYPYCLDVKEGKKEFFGSEESYRLDSDMCLSLRDRVEHVINEARTNRRLSHVFVDFLKDELRSKAKVMAVATRLISSAPLDYTVVWRMFFGAFSTAVMTNHTVSGMAPGICCYSDWDILVMMLQRHGKECFDGDFSFFDSSEQPSIHILILDFINAWYDDGPDNARIRRVLWMDLMHSRHIGGLGQEQKYIYQWNKSLPSGHPFTTIVNSIYSLVVLVYAYMKCTGDLTNFWSNVSTVTYGDDNNNNPSPAVSPLFNQTTVAKVLAEEFSLTYTAGNKLGELRTTFPLEETTFLKRGFVCRDNVWLCPLELNSFLYTIYWCKNRKLEKKILIDCLESSLEELSLHSPDVWDFYAPMISDVSDQMGHVSKAVIEQEQYFNLVRSRTDNWY